MTSLHDLVHTNPPVKGLRGHKGANIIRLNLDRVQGLLICLFVAKYDSFNQEESVVGPISEECLYLKEIKSRDRFIYLGFLRRFQHCTGPITTGSWKGRGNQYIQFVRVLYCKLPTNGKQLPAFPLEAVPGTEPRPQRWEARVLPLCHRGPLSRDRDPFRSLV